MPNYTLIIYNHNWEKLRQYSGTRQEVVTEFEQCIKSAKWKGCLVSWGTKRKVRKKFYVI